MASHEHATTSRSRRALFLSNDLPHVDFDRHRPHSRQPMVVSSSRNFSRLVVLSTMYAQWTGVFPRALLALQRRVMMQRAPAMRRKPHHGAAGRRRFFMLRPCRTANGFSHSRFIWRHHSYAMPCLKATLPGLDDEVL